MSSPTKAVLVVDGHEQDTKDFTLNADEWAALPGTVLPCSIESAIITSQAGGYLKNAVSVELQDITFKGGGRWVQYGKGPPPPHHLEILEWKIEMVCMIF